MVKYEAKSNSDESFISYEHRISKKNSIKVDQILKGISSKNEGISSEKSIEFLNILKDFLWKWHKIAPKMTV